MLPAAHEAGPATLVGCHRAADIFLVDQAALLAAGGPSVGVGEDADLPGTIRPQTAEAHAHFQQLTDSCLPAIFPCPVLSCVAHGM